MDKLDKYDIILNEKSCNYSYEIGDDFFSLIEATGIKKGRLNVSVSVRRKPESYELDFHIEGIVTCVCDRCLGDIDLEVDTDDSLTVKFGEEYDDGELLVLPFGEEKLNIAWYIYEFTYLSLPGRIVHDDGQCDENMQGVLEEFLICDSDGDENKNSESDIDPRWNALKKILNNN